MDDPDVPSLALCRELAAMGWSQVGEQLYYLPPDYEHASLCNHDAPCDRVAAPTLGEMIQDVMRRGWDWSIEKGDYWIWVRLRFDRVCRRCPVCHKPTEDDTWLGSGTTAPNAFAEAWTGVMRATKEVDRG